MPENLLEKQLLRRYGTYPTILFITQIRVVFDLSEDHKGRCINIELLSGPDLTNQIAGVLLRFREEQVAVMGDIEAMFHQAKIPDNQCSFLRFLWWEDCDTNKEIIDYEMTTHLFGGIITMMFQLCLKEDCK